MKCATGRKSLQTSTLHFLVRATNKIRQCFVFAPLPGAASPSGDDFWYFPSFDVTHLRTQNNPFASKHGNATYLLSHTRKMMENRPNNHSAVVLKSAEDCAICLDKIQRKKTLNCSHSFCSECIDSLFKLKPACPICNTYHGEYTGNQPEGTMTVMRSWQRLPGYERCGSIVIQYSFPAGIQGVRLTVLKEHNRPHEKATYAQSLCCTLTTPFNCV